MGDAVSSEILNTGWREKLGHDWLPRVTPEDAGRNLARIASDRHLTLFAHYTTDTAGHRQEMDPAVEALERVDAFLGGVLSGAPEDLTLLIVSDHGNIEDISAGHTRNPVLGVATGPGRQHAATARDLRDVATTVSALIGDTDDP